MKYLLQTAIILSLFSCGRKVVTTIPVPTVEEIVIDLPIVHPHFTVFCDSVQKTVILEIAKMGKLPRGWDVASYDIYYKKHTDSTYSHIPFKYEFLFKQPILLDADLIKMDVSFVEAETGVVKTTHYKVDAQDFVFDICAECSNDLPVTLKIEYNAPIHPASLRFSKYTRRTVSKKRK